MSLGAETVPRAKARGNEKKRIEAPPYLEWVTCK